MFAHSVTRASPIATYIALTKCFGTTGGVAPTSNLRYGRMDNFECDNGSTLDGWKGWRTVLLVRRSHPFMTVFPLFAMTAGEAPLALLERATLLGRVLLE